MQVIRKQTVQHLGSPRGRRMPGHRACRRERSALESSRPAKEFLMERFHPVLTRPNENLRVIEESRWERR